MKFHVKVAKGLHLYEHITSSESIRLNWSCATSPGGGGVLSIFVRRGCAVFQGIVSAYFF